MYINYKEATSVNLQLWVSTLLVLIFRMARGRGPASRVGILSLAMSSTILVLESEEAMWTSWRLEVMRHS